MVSCNPHCYVVKVLSNALHLVLACGYISCLWIYFELYSNLTDVAAALNKGAACETLTVPL